MFKGTDRLTVYHGTCIEFNEIDLLVCKDKRDFGIGFYTTTSLEQAKKWVKSQADRYGGSPMVMQFIIGDWDEIKVKEFAKASKSWLELVRQNRMDGGISHEFDIVIGPVANDRTYPTIARYIDGTYNVDEAIRRLKTWAFENQLSFHTELAVSKLIFTRRYTC